MLKRLFATAAAATMIGGAAFAQTAAPQATAPMSAAPAPAAPAAAAPAPAAPAASTTPRVTAAGDLIATAKASGQFNTLIKALDATNLTGVLQKTPNLTVFAPTDAAFAALPAGQLDELMKPAGAATLQKILTYHVINLRVDASKIKGAKGEVKTVEGASVMLDGSGDTLMVDSARIVQADVMATNGILHVVDKVLMPNDVPAVTAAAATDTAASAAASAAIPAPAPASAAPAGTAVAPTGAPQSTAPVNTTPPAAKTPM
jgi:uncharacterized surface protein with fasciclin (FAS1) repeats